MRRYSWIWIVLVLVLAGCLGRQGVLKPAAQDESVGVETAMIGQPQLVTFLELQAAPYSYRDRFIRVSGLYAVLPVQDCFPSSGPPTNWALISQDLRLDGTGFSAIARRIPQGATLTVDGIFRLYEGPAGCGKRPVAGNVWFLEALQIIQPNPLVLVDGVVADASLYLPSTAVRPGQTGAGANAGGNSTAVPPAGGYPPPLATVSGTIIATGTVLAIPTASTTATATGTPAAGTATLTTTPTATATNGAGGPAATATPTMTSTAPATALPSPTPTTPGGGGYPGPPTVTPEPTSTPPSYP